MNLHEYQAKQLFSQFGLPVPNGKTVDDAKKVNEAISILSGNSWIVKAQVHAGGRGKAGGVKLAGSVNEAENIAQNMLGKNLVTYQTDATGQPINHVLIEEVCDIDRELYLGAIIDRGSQRVVIIASTEGGTEIEKVAHETPEKILKIVINPLVGVMPYQIRALIFGLGLTHKQSKDFHQIIHNLVLMFTQKDLSLLEINPIVVTKQGSLLCLDGKVNIDSNALYRQKDLLAVRDTSQEDAREIKADEWDLNYISLDGNVGCMVNGAGLAMATMDLIKLHGGNPANFLDVGGGATAKRVAVALDIILSDKNVKSVLVNIFGGIVRCDLIAEGIIEAVSKTQIDVPLIVRLEGNNAKLGLEKLQASQFDIIVADSLVLAAEKAISVAGEGS